LILEGCYPYVRGGVSSWTHQFILAMPETEFVLWLLGAESSKKGQFKYELPKNVVEVHEVFLSDAYIDNGKKSKIPSFTPSQEVALSELLNCGNPDWNVIFKMFSGNKAAPSTFLRNEVFIEQVNALCEKNFQYISYSDFFYTVRSMMIPLIFLLMQDVPKADLYHSLATGYCGLMGSMASEKYNAPFLVSEHGIYTREREEEVLQADWITPYLKNLWIDLFSMFSKCAYNHAYAVTSLYGAAKDIQLQLGCNESKASVIPNGVRYEDFSDIPEKISAENDKISIGAVVRFAPIKDIKTMIYAFTELKHNFPNAELDILGDIDNEEYYQECVYLLEFLNISDINFVGQQNVKTYIGKFDFTILTSISEGLPLAVLESMAAGRPVVATDVGACREMLEKNDEYERCGIICPPMDTSALTSAMYRLCTDRGLRHEMSQIGRERAKKYYDYDNVLQKYKDIYEKAFEKEAV
jgi:glycosyltransferase involved in cell wall biosynthesis